MRYFTKGFLPIHGRTTRNTFGGWQERQTLLSQPPPTMRVCKKRKKSSLVGGAYASMPTHSTCNKNDDITNKLYGKNDDITNINSTMMSGRETDIGSGRVALTHVIKTIF